MTGLDLTIARRFGRNNPCPADGRRPDLLNRGRNFSGVSGMRGFAPGGRAKKEFAENLEGVLDAAYRAAVGLTRDRHDAEDLVQDAALRAWRNFRRFKRGTNFRAWMLKILKNVYINQYRKNRKQPVKLQYSEAGPPDLASPPGTPGGAAEFSSGRVEEAVAGLPAELREAVTFFYAGGLTYREIAEITDVPVGTVMSRLYRARGILKKQLPSGPEGKAE